PATRQRAGQTISNQWGTFPVRSVKPPRIETQYWQQEFDHPRKSFSLNGRIMHISLGFAVILGEIWTEDRMWVEER
ncbi:MAG: hypothetical protein O2875_08515, partial [Planctomycetota bacterium]|nr:hypothetical protein [Planctomycetota bacterium]